MLKEILSEFPIIYTGVSKINTGLINETYLVKGERASFILQNINPIFSPKITETLEKISNHLIKSGLKAQKIIKTKKID